MTAPSRAYPRALGPSSETLYMTQGIGAALSAAVAGGMVTLAGYSAAFLLLAGIAAAGLALFWIAMPETRPADEAA